MKLLTYCLLHYKEIPFYPTNRLKYLFSIIVYFIIAIFFNNMIKGVYLYLFIFIEVSILVYYLNLVYRVRREYFLTKNYLLAKFDNGYLSIDEFNYIRNLIKDKITLSDDRTIKGIVNQINCYQIYKNF